ncbi:rhodanese-like domain-containing protein [Chloroflexota bacterium]
MELRERMCSAMEEYFFKALRKGWHLTTSEELNNSIKSDEKIFLLDVREPDEFLSEHIEGAVNIPIHDLPDRIKELPEKLDQPIISVCLSGARSAYATMFLKVYGYTNIRNLDFGMTGWMNNGFPIVRAA